MEFKKITYNYKSKWDKQIKLSDERWFSDHDLNLIDKSFNFRSQIIETIHRDTIEVILHSPKSKLSKKLEIVKYPDEYYIVTHNFLYYLCDGKDGLKEFLESIQ